MVLQKVIEKVRNHSLDLSPEYLRAAVALAKQKQSAELAYALAEVMPEKRKQLEKIVLQAKDPMICAHFVTDIPDANVTAHKRIIFDSKNTESICYYMARVVPNKRDIIKAQNTIIERQDSKAAFDFYSSVDGADFKVLSQVAIDKKDLEALEGFKHFDGNDNADKTRVNLEYGKQRKSMLKLPKDELTK